VRPGDRGVVDQPVEPTDVSLDLREKGADRRRVGDIGRDADGASTDLVGGDRQHLLVARDEHRRAAFGRDGVRGGQADAARRAGDEDDPAGQRRTELATRGRGGQLPQTRGSVSRPATEP
jgi:hypothetical protein